MRIIQNNYHIMRSTCQHCKSVLELTHTDIHDSHQGGYFYNCAACGKKNQVKTKDIPPSTL